jgi:hypothetical protein
LQEKSENAQTCDFDNPYRYADFSAVALAEPARANRSTRFRRRHQNRQVE